LGRLQGRNFSGLVFDSDSADASDAPCMRKRRDSVRPIAERDQGQESKFPGEQSGQGRVLISGAQGSVVNRKRALFHGRLPAGWSKNLVSSPAPTTASAFCPALRPFLWPDFIIYRADCSSSASLQCRLAEKRIWQHAVKHVQVRSLHHSALDQCGPAACCAHNGSGADRTKHGARLGAWNIEE